MNGGVVTQLTPEARLTLSRRRQATRTSYAPSAVTVPISSPSWIWSSNYGRTGLSPSLLGVNSTARMSDVAVPMATDIVGLYLDPPDRAVVLCVDEKSQIQALDRTQPGLPLKKGRAATMTHDYKRHGTTTLFAALDVKSGKVIGDCMSRHPLPSRGLLANHERGQRSS